MRYNRKKVIKTLSQLTLATLISVVSGIGCLICSVVCCSLPVQAATCHSPVEVVQPESGCCAHEETAPLPSEADSCCAEEKETACAEETVEGEASLSQAFLDTPQPGCGMTCCGPFSTFVNEAAPTRTVDVPSGDVPGKVVEPAVLTTAHKNNLPAAIFLPNRGHTYLRCCTFLI